MLLSINISLKDQASLSYLLFRIVPTYIPYWIYDI